MVRTIFTRSNLYMTLNGQEGEGREKPMEKISIYNKYSLSNIKVGERKETCRNILT